MTQGNLLIYCVLQDILFALNFALLSFFMLCYEIADIVLKKLVC